MKKHNLKKSEVLREGYVKGLRKAQQLIKESLQSTHEDTELWNELDEEQQEKVRAYVECYGNNHTLEEILEKIDDTYIGTYEDWENFGYEAFQEGQIDCQWLVDNNFIDWAGVGNTLSLDHSMSSNGMTFRDC